MEAVAALNGGRITPVLLKGSALLATVPRDQMATRLVSDLDICVPGAAEFDASLECLRELGYRVFYRSGESATKCYADLERPTDVGMIDLLQGPPGHSFFYNSMGGITRYCDLRVFEQGEA